MADAAVLKGSNDGYEIILSDRAAYDDIFKSLVKLLDGLKTQTASTKPQKIAFEVTTGKRLFSAEERSEIEKVFADYPDFSIHKIISEVVTKEESRRMIEQQTVHILDKTIRNGQVETVTGDVLFLGDVHEGGKLFVSGNLFVLGSVAGIIQAGYPNAEDKLIIGDVHNAQQVRIGEQFEILDDSPHSDKINSSTVAYVNDLHILDYGEVENVSEINPKFFNQIGGINNG
ncbi:septum site-determining protein MinC [Lentilactobacillus sp. SPB1-3]|uniref:Septum site-determining protein MinC n=1 Tax=Lentilactobacillus terminaliae TaxID=3003483 RepID=A0ACD5DCE0_9LACO|nr:septum site-determining protein MinC [Lentilactobacillus sp. SPB1-3]MCZ0977388.1 cell division inhibitor [Lentilactobacillus sp. SPB1-3]